MIRLNSTPIRSALVAGAIVWAATPALAQDPVEPAPVDDAVTVPLAPASEAGTEGVAAFHAVDNVTELVIEVEGAAPDADHSAHLVSGTCADPGELRADLGSVLITEDGAGQAAATFEQPLEEIVAVPSALVIRAAVGEVDETVACGELDAAGAPDTAGAEEAIDA